jgi:hypothetical protein
MLHDNHLMRFVPLIPSDLAPAPWASFPAVELAWTGDLHPDWLRSQAEVHAIHLAAAPWTHALGATVLEVLRPRLELDFLVLPAGLPLDRQERAAFLGVLEGLLEATHGRRIKLALRPDPGATQGLAGLLKEVHGEAVGFCWNGQTGPDLEAISDRLFCAVGAPGEAFAPLQHLGYRWNLALAGRDPAPLREALRALEQSYPTVYFPADLPPTGSGPLDPQECP